MNNYERGIQEETEYTINLYTLTLDLWKGIKRFGWLVVVLAILSAGINYLRTNRTYFPYYKASATFTVNLSADSGSSIYDDNLKASQMSKTFPYIITSGVLKNVIAADLGVTSVPESITAENVEDTNLFTINVTSGDAKKAYDVLQSVIKNYPQIAETVVGSTKLTILDETGVIEEPANRPNYRNILKMGALPGAFLGALIILIYALTRKTIHSAEDLIELSSMKHLGSLPKVAFKKRGRKFNKSVTLLNKKIPAWYRENIYKIRTRVEKIADNSEMKSILVTSAIQGEGKSTFTFNLALAMAEGGKKVVLVDCDLRHPSIRNMLPMEDETPGLEEILNGEAELKDVLKHYDNLNISVIAGSSPVQNASELLGSPKMWEIFEELKDSADYVILDSPPSAILTDASDLAKYADGVIFVVKQDHAKVSQILESLEHLAESSNTEMIGSVLSGSNAGLSGYENYGKYGRHGSYGYGRKKHSVEV